MRYKTHAASGRTKFAPRSNNELMSNKLLSDEYGNPHGLATVQLVTKQLITLVTVHSSTRYSVDHFEYIFCVIDRLHLLPDVHHLPFRINEKGRP